MNENTNKDFINWIGKLSDYKSLQKVINIYALSEAMWSLNKHRAERDFGPWIEQQVDAFILHLEDGLNYEYKYGDIRTAEASLELVLEHAFRKRNKDDD